MRHHLGSWFEKLRYEEDVRETIRVPFEDTMLPIPKGYDHYLRTIYGDYMKLPPLDEIVPHTVKVEIW